MDEVKSLSWGVCSVGKICNDFVLAINSLSSTEHKLTAVAARDIKRAKSFADFHSINKAYGSYEELAKDKDVDIVYIGVINNLHYDIAKMMIESGKHVLCEKPLCINVDETNKLCSLAQKKSLFLMEAVWSRFFPAYKKAKEIMASGAIGEIKHCHTTFGDCFPITPRIERKDMGGGSLLDLGIYCAQFAQFAFNNEKPTSQLTNGSLLKSGVDGHANILLKYSDGRSASISSSVTCFLANEGYIYGTKGYIKVGPFFWCPTTVEVYKGHDKCDTFTFELPPPPQKGEYNFRNSVGLQYQATEVRNCILKGLIESPLHKHEDSIRVAEILEKARIDLKYNLPQDSISR